MKHKTFLQLKIKFQFMGFHRNTEAPEHLDYQKNLHRHIFHVTCWLTLNGKLDIDACSMKQNIEGICRQKALEDLYTKTWGCEKWAGYILEEFDFDKVEVLEDNENGTVISKLN